ncbi:MAG: hypothetical protein AVDCRST_MAG41-1059, partial [uncultured Corynebacteriales bacterium]
CNSAMTEPYPPDRRGPVTGRRRMRRRPGAVARDPRRPIDWASARPGPSGRAGRRPWPGRCARPCRSRPCGRAAGTAG